MNMLLMVLRTGIEEQARIAAPFFRGREAKSRAAIIATTETVTPVMPPHECTMLAYVLSHTRP
jgi:hypothetical protein